MDGELPPDIVTPAPLETTGGMQGLASQLAAEADTFTPPRAASSAPGPAAGSDITATFTDKWGRSFDPTLHLTNLEGQPALRGGKTLIVRSGMKPSGPPIKKAAPSPASGSSIPGLEPEAPTPAAVNDAPRVEAAPAPAPAAPTVTPEERKRRAEMDAETEADALELLAKLLAGQKGRFQVEDGRSERDDITDSGKRWMETENVELPFGSRLLHAIQVGRFVVRVVSTPESEAKLTKLVNLIRRVTGGAPAPAPRKTEQPLSATPAQGEGAGAPGNGRPSTQLQRELMGS